MMRSRRHRVRSGVFLTSACLVFAATAAIAGDPPAGSAGDGDAGDKLKNTLRWTTATEVDNFGFDVYRGLSKDGPFRRITDRPIEGAGTSDVPTRYVFEDEKIEPGIDYYYYVESISMGGEREPFTPVIKAPAKRPDGSVAPAPDEPAPSDAEAEPDQSTENS